MQVKRIEEESESNKFAMADAALHLLITQKMKKSCVENAQNHFGKLELCIQDLEEGVESLLGIC